MKKRNTMEFKMKTYFSIVFFILIIVFGLIIMQYSSKRYQDQSYQYLRNTVELNIRLLDKYFSSLQNVAMLIVSGQDVRTAVAYRNQHKDIDYSIELYNQRNADEALQHLKTVPYIKNAVIIGSDGKALYSYKEHVNENYNFGKQEWFKQIKNMEETSIRNSYFTGFHPSDYLVNGKGADTISMVTPVQNKLAFDFKNNSYLICDVDLSPLLLANTGREEVQLAINNGTEWIHLPESKEVSNSQLNKIKNKLDHGEDYFVIKGKGSKEQDLLVVTATTDTDGWNIVGIKSLKDLQDTKFTVLLFIIGTLLVSGVIITFISGILSKTILNPVNQLVRSFNRITIGDYAVSFPENSTEEIAVLSKTAENMIQNLLRLSDKLLQEEKKLSEAQLRELQNQINPHFLNNVLQSIKALAVNGEAEKISKVTTLLGKMLSYSVYQPYEKVPLETELQYTEHYILIQNVRFEDRIFYSIDCDQELADIMVPKLIIQPIVENALKHGFKNRETGFLTINVERDESDICIIITDNGSGMEEGLVSKMNEEFAYKNSYSPQRSIGLLNVNQRIRSEFGASYGLKLISRNNKGTSVIITLPSIS
ncbi:sensor histidine kinase [Bacillus sp. B-jedd]|uniref:sensor histidine kinase n=1 Tax=Bacillus sp. B-jedd TaxID=1476857 RepID=UPI00066272E3|nr:sensor histidine kinase [Bacillus sp. B-jedd]